MLNPQALQLRVGVDVGSQCHSVAVGLTDGSLLEEFELNGRTLSSACGGYSSRPNLKDFHVALCAGVRSRPGLIGVPGGIQRDEGMRRLRRILFSTGPRFGVTVGCLGLAFLSLAPVLQHLFPLSDPGRAAEIGGVMFLSGFAWALLTRHIGPCSYIRGGGIVFAILAAVIIPSAATMDLGVVVRYWGYLAWGFVCLVILVMLLAGAYRYERMRADELRELYEEELARTGRGYPEPHVPWPKTVSVRSGRGMLRPAGEIGARSRPDLLPEWSFTTSARSAHHGAAEPLLQANLRAVYSAASAGTGIPYSPNR